MQLYPQLSGLADFWLPFAGILRKACNIAIY